MEKHGIQVWPDMVKLSAAGTARINTWTSFARSRSGGMVQVTRACLVDSIEQLERTT
jgi:hypothetical protein